MVNRKKTRRRKTIQWSTEKPYNGQQRNHTMVNRQKTRRRETIKWSTEKNTKERNHKMVNRKKTRRRETIQWSTEKKHEGEKPYNGPTEKTHTN